MSPNNSRLRILVAPLDWGLGHTTRCIPIINELLKLGVEVWLAGNDIQQKILRSEFPNCSFLPLQGYNVQYSSKKVTLPFKIALQIPGIWDAIKKENEWLIKAVDENGIQGVISDNRYGLYHKNIPCAFVTHQLSIKTNLGAVVDAWLQKINYKKINRFIYCWIPDYDARGNLAGELSHPAKMPDISSCYIGSLSRLSPTDATIKKDAVLFILSGPEPQRTILEEKIFSQIKSYKGKITVVRGLPESDDIPVFDNVTIYNHLSKEALSAEMTKATYIICRSGYSSVMDINALKAKAIFVPTPGQTEQEYLAKYLMENGFAPYISQESFNISSMLNKAATFRYSGFISPKSNLLTQVIKSFLQDCQKATTL